MIVRCKAFVASLTSNEWGQTTVNLQLAYSQTPGTENHQFHSASPSGNLKLFFSGAKPGEPNPANDFVPGSWWYIDTMRTECIGTEGAESFCWLSGIERSNGYYLKDGFLVRQEGNQLRAKTTGRFNGMQFDSDIYIANEHVYPEFAEIGTLYVLGFTPTTKEGS